MGPPSSPALFVGRRSELERFAEATRHVRLVPGRRRVDCGQRGALLGVLAALCARPGRPVSADEIARVAWGIEYHPLRHRSRIAMAVSRARSLLGAGMIAGGEGGYTLVPRGPWAVIESVPSGTLA